jgi:hypothetical protein
LFMAEPIWPDRGWLNIQLRLFLVRQTGRFPPAATPPFTSVFRQQGKWRVNARTKRGDLCTLRVFGGTSTTFG